MHQLTVVSRVVGGGGLDRPSSTDGRELDKRWAPEVGDGVEFDICRTTA